MDIARMRWGCWEGEFHKVYILCLGGGEGGGSVDFELRFGKEMESRIYMA